MADVSSSGIWQSYAESLTTEPAAAKTRSTSTELDKNAFLSLLVTQLQYQDPLNPTNDKEFLAQMAQFTALEQMQNLNSTMSQSHAYSMVGKYVTTETYYSSTNTIEKNDGIVESVKITASGTLLVINGKDVSTDNVTSVSSVDSSYMDSISQSVYNTQNLALIGKYIQAVIIEDGAATEFVEGKVDNIKFVDGSTILMVGDKEILPGEVLSVSDQHMLVGKTMSAIVQDPETEEDTTITGVIQGLNIKDSKFYVTINDTDIPISTVHYLTDALKTVGTNISYNDVSGKVSGVVIKNELPYLQIGDDLVSFTAYKGLTE